MVRQTAFDIVGGLSRPSKMPGWGHSIPANQCQVGSRLREVKGSTCEGCYALKNLYVTPIVKNALEKRLEALKSPRWIEAMVKLIPKSKDASNAFFRVHDSGDLQGVWHLENWNKIAFLRPDIQFWLPTREYAYVKQFLAKYTPEEVAPNLVIRLSEHMIDEVGPAKKMAAKYKNLGYNITWSGVMDKKNLNTNVCPAPNQNNECKDCRACWSKDVSGVVYHKH